MRTTTLTIGKVFQVNFLIAPVDFTAKQAHTENISHNSLCNIRFLFYSKYCISMEVTISGRDYKRALATIKK
jgi:hypothetical protein